MITCSPLEREKVSKAIRPAWPASPTGATAMDRRLRAANTRTRIWGDSTGKGRRLARSGRRKQRQSVRFRHRSAVRIAQWQRQELVHILPQIADPGTRPISAPQHAVNDLGQSGKVVQQLQRRNAGDIEPDMSMTSQDEERLFHIEGPPAVRHDEGQDRKST